MKNALIFVSALTLLAGFGCDPDNSGAVEERPAAPGQAIPGEREPGMTNPMEGGDPLKGIAPTK
jgi:hypothetical protein